MVKKSPQCCGDFLFNYLLLTRARNSVLGRNDVTRRAEITAGTPVLGLRPMRADLFRILKVPNPEIFTSSPLTNASDISWKIISIMRLASAAVNPKRSRKRVANSIRVNLFITIPLGFTKIIIQVRPKKSTYFDMYNNRLILFFILLK